MKLKRIKNLALKTKKSGFTTPERIQVSLMRGDRKVESRVEIHPRDFKKAIPQQEFVNPRPCETIHAVFGELVAMGPEKKADEEM